MIYVENFELPDDKWPGMGTRSCLKYSGYIDNDKKPVANTHALLTYKWCGDSWSDEGCFSDKLLLSGSGKRDRDNGYYKEIGEFNGANGELSGDAAREFKSGTVDFGSWNRGSF